jgi:hypothetical protein
MTETDSVAASSPRSIDKYAASYPRSIDKSNAQGVAACIDDF